MARVGENSGRAEGAGLAEGYVRLSHGFDPVFDARSRILVLGSFPRCSRVPTPSTTAIRKIAFGA